MEKKLYLVREKDGTLVLVYTKYKPIKVKSAGKWDIGVFNLNWIIIDSNKYSEVKWEDEEPTEIELDRI